MKIIIKSIAIGALSLLALSCSATEATEASSDADAETINETSDGELVDMSGIPENLEEEVQNAITRQSMDNVLVLDVRTDAEWNELHAVGATHWGLVEHIENGEFPDVDLDTEIYIYCRSGNRAGQAIRIMQEAGFTNLTNIRGLEDWIDAGGETTSGVDGDDQ